jgi:hypothetical protein
MLPVKPGCGPSPTLTLTDKVESWVKKIIH